MHGYGGYLGPPADVALQSAGAENLEGKVLVDLVNPLNKSGMPPSLTVVNDDSPGEQIRRAFPGTNGGLVEVRRVAARNGQGGAGQLQFGVLDSQP